MRRLYRRPLLLKTRLDLRARQKLCRDYQTARDEWKRYRGLAAARPLLEALRAMAGPRHRCFYCSDSRGADVDHFVPVVADRGLTFVWENLQWVCPECNRSKTGQAPEEGGVRALDPTIDDPWAHLVLDTASGVIAPRFQGGTEDPRGRVT